MSNRNKRPHSNATAPTVRPSTTPEINGFEAPTPKTDPHAVGEWTPPEEKPLGMKPSMSGSFGGPAVLLGDERPDLVSAGERLDLSDIATSSPVDERGEVILSHNGKLTTKARGLIHALRIHVGEMIDGIPHRDNTAARCRVDLDGHDACDVCNAIEAAMRTMRVP